ncbi:pentatricopeptide repeat-containing protein At5g08305 [Macadamia integrifolia]|uniref:pentatricopeptide repeat-containing protein At5g08305 n=1 Tax=Macadamia integrifolia TaxID=60698 RepID=UPI001C4F9710|nr:pentatricopeptide repeat-containing protein At5g08305 [Macadamia integrifolia]
MVKFSSFNGSLNLNNCLISFLDRCKSMLELRQIHALIITFGLSEDDFFMSRVLSFSAVSDSGDIHYSNQVFRHLSNPTIFNWNTIIRGYSRSKNPNGSISIFIEMLRAGVSPDHLTFPFLAKSSARLSSLQHGVAVHNCIAKTGFEFDRFVRNSLIHMYAACGQIISARKLFDEMPQKNLVSWNAMVDGYAKCGDLVAARQTFELMSERDVVSWSSLIDGYVKSGDHREALSLFERMQRLGTKANEVTMVSVLCACAHLGALEQGRMMHHYVNDSAMPLSLALRTSLVDMYAKCGAIDEALAVFHGVPMEQTDVLIWNAMIGGLATHGLVKESLELFKVMQAWGISPDEITYLCLLSACAHGGLVGEAWNFFNLLNTHGMTPKCEHYACMVDVLGRAGRLDKAFQFLDKMPVEPSASTLGALLSGCRMHGRLDLAEEVGRKLIELEPDHDGRYIGLSNVYAVARRWNDARTLREAMEKRGVKKFPGCSFVEVGRTLHKFIAHDKAHPQLVEIYLMLNNIAELMKLDGGNETQDNDTYEIGEDG